MPADKELCPVAERETLIPLVPAEIPSPLGVKLIRTPGKILFDFRNLNAIRFFSQINYLVSIFFLIFTTFRTATSRS